MLILYGVGERGGRFGGIKGEMWGGLGFEGEGKVVRDDMVEDFLMW